jgi:hypothetical protein
MDTQRLNVTKLFWVLTGVTALGLFIASLRVGNSFLLAFFGSLVLAIPVGFIVGVCLTFILAGISLIKPFLKWFADWLNR